MSRTLLIFLLLIFFIPGLAFAQEKSDGAANKAEASRGDKTASAADEQPADNQAASEEDSRVGDKSLKEKKGDDDPMAPFAIAPRLGYSWFGPARGDFQIGDLSARNCLLVNLGLNMGGSGAGFNLTPYYSYEKGDSAFHSLGFGMEFIYRWLLAKKWYPHFGFGSKIGYLFASDIDVGLEIYLRIPVGFSYYFLEDLGLIFDFGFGYGFTGIMPKNVDTIYEFSDLRFGHGFMVDMSLGLTFP